jgi:hypothetical protein
MIGQSNSSALLREASPIRLLISSDCDIAIIEATIESRSLGFESSAQSLFTYSGIPPTRSATMGRPQAIAYNKALLAVASSAVIRKQEA